jgi:hypothetical protein
MRICGWMNHHGLMPRLSERNAVIGTGAVAIIAVIVAECTAHLWNMMALIRFAIHFVKRLVSSRFIFFSCFPCF